VEARQFVVVADRPAANRPAEHFVAARPARSVQHAGRCAQRFEDHQVRLEVRHKLRPGHRGQKRQPAARHQPPHAPANASRRLEVQGRAELVGDNKLGLARQPGRVKHARQRQPRLLAAGKEAGGRDQCRHFGQAAAREHLQPAGKGPAFEHVDGRAVAPRQLLRIQPGSAANLPGDLPQQHALACP